MFNMISAELYKLRKSKSFWIMIAIVVGISAFMSIVFGLAPADEMMGMRPESASEMLNGALPMNIQIILFILVGFVIVFVCSDFDSGTVRNPLAVGVSRVEYYIAKFVGVLITCAIFVVVTIIATVLPYLMFEPWGDAFNFGNFMASVGIGYLILVAQSTLFMGIGMGMRKIGATLGIILGYLVLDMIISSFILMMEVEGLLRTLANILPSPAGYYLGYLTIGEANFGNVMMVVVVSLAMIVVMSLLAVGSLVKKDV